MILRKILLTMLVTSFVFAACNNPKTSEEESTEVSSPRNEVEERILDAPQPTGTYEGTLPCADCEGIETTLKLRPNGTYEMEQVYVGAADKGENKFKQHGNWIVNTTTDTLQLKEVTQEDVDNSNAEANKASKANQMGKAKGDSSSSDSMNAKGEKVAKGDSSSSEEDSTSGRISLEEGSTLYKITDDALIMLGRDGKEATGPTASAYILKKK